MSDPEDLASLSYRELQQECIRFNLSASGKAGALRRRLRSHWTANNSHTTTAAATRSDRVRAHSYGAIEVIVFRDHEEEEEEEEEDEEERPAKRPKRCPADDLICPITLELPWDPVTAEDGRVYEREAIETHLKNHQQTHKSPITNEPMGTRLLPSPQIKSLIETLIENGSITGALLHKWNEKVDQQRRKDLLLQKANAGDAKAMKDVAHKHRHGKDGFAKNQCMAYQWFRKSHDKGYIPGTAFLGSCLLKGCGVSRAPAEGILYTSLAAANGSNLSSFYLGMALADGHYGLTPNPKEAVAWLEKCLLPTCRYKHLSESAHDKARQRLEQLKQELEE